MNNEQNIIIYRTADVVQSVWYSCNSVLPVGNRAFDGIIAQG